MGAGTIPAEPEFFFCLVNHTTFRNFATADFYQIWSRNVVRCPVDEIGKTFWKIFTLGVICPQNLTSKLGQTCTSLRAGYRSRDELVDILFTPRCSPMAREFTTFLYDIRLQSYGASKLPNFRILAYFPHTKPLKRTFR